MNNAAMSNPSVMVVFKPASLPVILPARHRLGDGGSPAKDPSRLARAAGFFASLRMTGWVYVAGIFGAAIAHAAQPWHQEPYLLKAGDTPLDTATSLNKEQFNKVPKENAPGNFTGDTLGHAAPWWTDLAGRGVNDLLVGAFGGGFRVYRNLGTNAAPRFGADYEYLRAGEGYAQVHIHCCIASNPRLTDLTGDGVADLLSGNWFHGELTWWQGLGGGKFGPTQTLSDQQGRPVLYEVPGNLADMWKNSQNFAAVGHLVDWFNEGKPALLIGTGHGHLVVRRNTGTGDKPTYSNQNDFEILIDGQPAMPDGHASPIVVDWDGDGRWDILSGSLSGTVYFFRNTGKTGAPEFKTREVLLASGLAEQWVERGQHPQRGIRSYPQAVDFNGDGKLDLLLGDFCQTITPRDGLTPDQERDLRVLKGKLDDLDRRSGYDQRDVRGRSRSYAHAADPKPNEELTALLDEMAPHLQLHHLNRFRDLTPFCSHGQIWVYLRR
jgi:hypothetical protein